MNDYISSGLDKDLVDPDGGVNAEKKKAELGLLSKNKDNVPLAMKQLPDKGFEVGLSRIPTIGYSQIWKYLIEDIELKSHSPLPPREGRHKVGKMDPSIFPPEITYGMLRIVI